jgi:hypothetical protein
MTNPSLEQLCELGQQQLMEMRYLESDATLARAERTALTIGNWDVLSRLYMPLQEARRQRRQRCGEGIVRLDLLAEEPSDHIEARHVLEHYPAGQLLVAGWGTIEPALAVQEMAAALGFYVETFLAATYPVTNGRAVMIVPLKDTVLPEPRLQPIEDLRAEAPVNCLVLSENELPRGPRKGTYTTYGEVMAMWERLHRPFLAAADREPDLIRKIDAYRQTIRVDYACEFAHQRLSDAARELARQSLNAAASEPTIG